MVSTPWTVRVYGIYVKNNHVLALREWFEPAQCKIVKFPGGGVNKTESLSQALLRELEEELGIDRNCISIEGLLYVADQPVYSAVFEGYRVLSIYFRIDILQDCHNKLKTPSNITWIPLCWQSLEMFHLVHDRMAFIKLLGESTQKHPYIPYYRINMS